MTISEVNLTYPNGPHREDGLVAYATMRLSGDGLTFFVKSMKLMCDTRTLSFFVQMPHEPRRVRCPATSCVGRNADHANWCNWCGAKLVPVSDRGWFYDLLVPADQDTRAAVLAALVAEHRKKNPEPATA